MKHNIRYSPEALRDLDEIWDYILTELCNPSAAKNTVGSIQDSINQLANFPEMGALLSSVTSVVSDYRFLVTGNYMTFYRIAGADVYVDRILYGRRNYLRILFGEES